MQSLTNNIHLGVAPGSRSEPAGVAVVECTERGDVWHFRVRRLDQLPPNTALPVLADRVGEIVRRIKERTGELPTALYVNVTGRGRAITDPIQERCKSVHQVTPCYFNYGDRQSEENGEVTIGKGYVVGRLQVLLQTGRLHLPETAEARTLAQELLGYEVKPVPQANEQPGAFRVGTRDELVTAVGLAVQTDDTGKRGYSIELW